MKQFWLAFLAGIFCVSIVPAQQADKPRTLYVENSLARTLSQLDLDGGRLSQNVLQLGQMPNQIIAYREQLFVLNSAPAEVMVIDGRSLQVTSRIALPEGSNPYQMALAGSRRLYITLLLANSVAVVDLAQQKVSKLIPVGIAPQGVTVEQNRAWVSNTGGYPDYSRSSVMCIDLAADSVLIDLQVPANPQVVRAAPDYRLYVLCSGAWGANGGKLAVIDPYAPPSYAAPAVVDTIAIGGYPGDLVVLPDGTAMMSDWGDAASGFLYRVNIYNGEISADAARPLRVGRGAMRFYWDKTAGDLYLSVFDQDAIQKIDPASGAVLATWPMGDGAQDIAIVEAIAASDPWADAVADFTPGSNWSRNGYDFFPVNVLGPPDPSSAISAYNPSNSPAEVLSLGHGGSITLEFNDNVIVDAPGADFIVFENVFVNLWTMAPFKEAGMVEVSQDGRQFYAFPCDTLTGKGFAGVSPVKSTLKPTDPELSGADAFDLADLGLAWVRYVRITDAGDLWQEGPWNGDFDLDAVVAVHSQAGSGPQPEGAVPAAMNYPNPFNQGTSIRFTLAQEMPVVLKVYALTGRLIDEIDLGILGSGPQRVFWDGRDRAGLPAGSGLYLGVLEAGGLRQSMKMTMLR